MQFENLLSPCEIGSLTIKNRIAMPPMQTSYADTEGFITDPQIDYYVERAKGGVGLIVFEHTGVLEQGKASPNMTLLSSDEHILGFRKLIDAVHKEGVKLAVQLNHAGRQTSSKITGMPIVAPSPVPCPIRKEVPRELSTDQIHRIIGSFTEAALRAKKAGADAIEIHMAHGYLIAEFLSPFSNKRSDEYGGDILGRTKLAVEVLTATREKVGPDFPIICRLSGDEYVEGGLILDDTKKIAKVLESMGADALDISAALGGRPMNQPTYYADEGALVHLAAGIKSVVGVPVITVGRIRNLFLAETIVRERRADVVSMGRALIADPHLPRKTFENKVEDIVWCISCNRCLQSLDTGPLSCTVNPEAGRETEFRLTPASEPKKIVIIGGGPAGMKTAQIAALRGHDVTLYERSDRLGGNMTLAAIPPKKDILLEPVTYLEGQLRKLPVNLRMRERFSIEMVEEIGPDAVIVATGSRPYFPNIKGIEESRVLTYAEVLAEQRDVGSNVAIVGGGGIGAELADYLSGNGRNVTLVEMKNGIALDLPDHLQYHLNSRLIKKDVEILVSTKVVEFRSGALIVEDGRGKRILKEFDSIIIALGAVPDDEIARDLERKNIEFHTIGDARDPREAREALFEGQAIASRI